MVRPHLARTFRALAHRNFRLFVGGQLISMVGTWMQGLAQSWLVWRLTHSTTMLGAVAFAQMGPVLLFGLAGGVAADRFDRRRLVIATQTAALVQAALLAALTLGGGITAWQVVALASVMGVINAVDFPGRQALLVRMVGREDLPNAIALNSSIFNGARIVGPSIAGYVVALWGEGTCFAVNAVSYVAVIGGLLAMRLPPEPVHDEPQGRTLREGLAYAWHTPLVRALLALMAVTSLFGISFNAFLPAVADAVHGRGALELGWLMTAMGAGALTGAIYMAQRARLDGLVRLVATRCAGFALGLVAFAAVRTFWGAMAAVAVVGHCLMVQMAATNTLLQTVVEDRLRGRLMSLYTVVFAGLTPVGALAIGALAERVRLPRVLAGGGAVVLAAALAFAWFRTRTTPTGTPSS